MLWLDGFLWWPTSREVIDRPPLAINPVGRARLRKTRVLGWELCAINGLINRYERIRISTRRIARDPNKIRTSSAFHNWGVSYRGVIRPMFVSYRGFVKDPRFVHSLNNCVWQVEHLDVWHGHARPHCDGASSRASHLWVCARHFFVNIDLREEQMRAVHWPGSCQRQ